MTSFQGQRPTYRLMAYGEFTRPSGDWGGFYACRQLRATSQSEAVAIATELFSQDWEGPSAHLGKLTCLGIIACWNVAWFDWRRVPNAGHALFNDEPDAQKGCLDLELKVAHAPLAIRHKLIGEIDGKPSAEIIT